MRVHDFAITAGWLTLSGSTPSIRGWEDAPERHMAVRLSDITGWDHQANRDRITIMLTGGQTITLVGGGDAPTGEEPVTHTLDAALWDAMLRPILAPTPETVDPEPPGAVSPDVRRYLDWLEAEAKALDDDQAYGHSATVARAADVIARRHGVPAVVADVHEPGREPQHGPAPVDLVEPPAPREPQS